jgi:hypothetical protein
VKFIVIEDREKDKSGLNGIDGWGKAKKQSQLIDGQGKRMEKSGADLVYGAGGGTWTRCPRWRRPCSG